MEYGYWTLDRCKEEALKYEYKTDFQKKSPSSYIKSHKNGWLEDICKHMINKPRKIKWTKEKCQEESLKYKTKKDFQNGSPSTYSISLYNGWLDDICSHMIKTYKWTKEKCQEESLKYKTKTDFLTHNCACYSAAYRNNWLDDICSHMIELRKPNNYWTKDKCEEIAKKYNNKSIFLKENASVYEKSNKNGWLDDICSHMKVVGNRYKRCIYAYIFSDKSVYIGLTYDIDVRNNQHLNRGTVYNHINKNNNYELIKLTDYIDVNIAKIKEGEYVEYYRNDGWKILNKVKTGNTGGSTLKWTKEKCQKLILKCNTKSELKNINPSAYNSSYNNGWLDEIWENKKLIIKYMKKTINIDAILHERLSKYCKDNKLKINELVNDLIKDHLDFELKEKSLLPLILKDNRGDIFETIICSEISSEYRNSLPKGITLIRNSKDGSGYIANYKQV